MPNFNRFWNPTTRLWLTFGGLALLAGCTQDLTNLNGENIFADGKNLTENVVVNCTETDQDFFDRAVWPTLVTSCVGCHGEANASGSDAPPLVYPANRSDAYGIIRDYVEREGIKLANKPSMNGEGHTGGKVLTLNSTEVSGLAEFVVRVQDGGASCLDNGGQSAREAGFSDVINISAARTVRKAAILMQGRMPTQNELSSAQSSEQGLADVLMGYLQGDTFDRWLMNSANDHLLTRKYVTGQTEAQEALSADTYNYSGLYDRTSAAFDAAEAAEVACADAGGMPAADAAQPECREAQALRATAGIIYRETQRAIAEEPLQLIRHVVSNDRPYREILTADYMMMNPFTYDVLDGATWSAGYDDMDATDWRPGHIRQYQVNWNTTLQAKTGKAYLPSAGVLSSPVFLLRYPSTDTNRNRARARWTYYYFLGTDIERLAVRAMDPEELKNVTNPGAEGSSCFGCHKIMDPVAGAFQSWGNASQYLVRNGNDSLPQVYVDGDEYVAGDHWYRGQLKPGFNGTDMPVNRDYGNNTTHDDGLQWLAEQLVADARFGTGTAKFWFKGVFGRDPLLAPTATEDADYEARLQAYLDEQDLIAEWAADFRAANDNLKTLLVDMMMSPLFRGESTTGSDAQRLAALDQLGLGRLLSPEQLARKLEATTGFKWRWPWQDNSQLLESYYMFYGGIDSDGITKRPEALNSLMYSVTERMANELSCSIVASEFWPAMPRTLFTGVAIETDPNTAEGEAAIRGAINNMMWRLWGVSDSDELDALWGLYKALYDQRIAWRTDDDQNGGVFVADYLSYAAEWDGDRTDTAQDEFCQLVNAEGDEYPQDWAGIAPADWANPALVREHLGSNYNPEQTLRPWVGVLTAMLTDIQFLTE